MPIAPQVAGFRLNRPHAASCRENSLPYRDRSRRPGTKTGKIGKKRAARRRRRTAFGRASESADIPAGFKSVALGTH